MIQNNQKHRPNGAAAESGSPIGAPPKGAPVFLKRAKLGPNSDFDHVRTYSWLHVLRNTQGTRSGTYLGNICGICTEYIRNIHKYLWCKIIRNTGAAFGGRPTGSVFLIILHHKYAWIFLSCSLYIPYIFPKYVPYIFPCVFLNLWSQE